MKSLFHKLLPSLESWVKIKSWVKNKSQVKSKPRIKNKSRVKNKPWVQNKSFFDRVTGVKSTFKSFLFLLSFKSPDKRFKLCHVTEASISGWSSGFLHFSCCLDVWLL